MYRWILATGLLFCVCLLFAEIIRPDKGVESIALGTVSVFGVLIFINLIEKSIQKDET